MPAAFSIVNVVKEANWIIPSEFQIGPNLFCALGPCCCTLFRCLLFSYNCIVAWEGTHFKSTFNSFNCQESIDIVNSIDTPFAVSITIIVDSLGCLIIMIWIDWIETTYSTMDLWCTRTHGCSWPMGNKRSILLRRMCVTTNWHNGRTQTVEWMPYWHFHRSWILKCICIQHQHE